MTVSIVFLRGVNVGGVTIRSAELKQWLAALDGVTEVATVLATGNAVVRTTLSAPALRDAAEQALAKNLGRPVRVIVQSLAQVRAVLDEVPYALDDPSTHAYVTFVSSTAGRDALAEVAHSTDQEHAVVGAQALAWTCPRGESLQTGFAKAQGKGTLPDRDDVVTTRNARTIRKVVAAAERL